jgi:hypothetical protein
MKYAVEMASGVMIYIPSFPKIGSGIHKLIGRFRKLLLKTPALPLMNAGQKCVYASIYCTYVVLDSSYVSCAAVIRNT